MCFTSTSINGLISQSPVLSGLSHLFISDPLLDWAVVVQACNLSCAGGQESRRACGAAERAQGQPEQVSESLPPNGNDR